MTKAGHNNNISIYYTHTDGEIPYDGVPKSAHITIQTTVTVLYSMLASAGLVFSVACLVFNFMARNSRLLL